MGTNAHQPARDKNPSEWATGHAHDADKKAAGPGVRPGTKSKLLEARERAEKRLSSK